MSARLRSSIVASVLAAWPAAPLMCQGGETFIYFEPVAVCNSASLNEEAQKVRIDTEGLAPGMISPDAAKRIALCWVPGQISSGEIESNGKRTVYEIRLLPTNKKTYSKVIVDAY